MAMVYVKIYQVYLVLLIGKVVSDETKTSVGAEILLPARSAGAEFKPHGLGGGG